MQKPTDGVKVLAANRKARHEYIIEDSIEAGIALTGTEIKSIRTGRANLQDSFAVDPQRRGLAGGRAHLALRPRQPGEPRAAP